MRPEHDSTTLADVPVPKPGRGQVLIAPRAVGVCGSDLHTWRGTVSWQLATPVILGHEMAGEIVDIGAECGPWRVGDRVVCETNGSVCGKCRMCRTGSPQHCPDLKVFGAHTDGFFAARCIASIETLHSIPTELDFVTASMTEPVAVAYAGVISRGHLELGEHVVVVGAGAIGIFAAQIARAAGAASVTLIGVDRDVPKAPLIASLGLGELVVSGRDNVVEAVKGQTRQLGADLVIDAAGVSAAMQTALDVVAVGGRIVKIGWGPNPFGYSLDPVVAKVVSIVGSRGHGWLDWERVLTLLSSRTIDVDSCISAKYEIGEWETAFRDMESGRNVKSVVLFHD
ncbi:zinc-dependent alcohol dehydrogenase [Subtercola frigoramans]